MKKLTALLLSVVLVLSLAACGSANKPASSTTQPETSAPTEQPATEPSESSSTAPAESEPETQPETGKTLVVYYSASGNTERVAKDIAEAAGADLFEVVPTEVYTSEDLNWTNPDSRVSREHDDESLRDVPLTTTEVPDWDSYDTVFIGYPIWWGIAAWPVDTFVKNNDFTGKTVIHPNQIPVVNEMLRVSQRDYADARAILNWDTGSGSLVSASEDGGRMNEYNTHSRWARRIVLRAERYGVRA